MRIAFAGNPNSGKIVSAERLRCIMPWPEEMKRSVTGPALP